MPQLMVVLGVTFTTSWQQDRLVHRELFDNKTSRVVPDYEIEVDGFDGQIYGYWPAEKCCFDSMLSPTVRAEVRARLFHLVVTLQSYATRFRNLCHEASADYTAIMELPFDQASAQCRVTILHEICTAGIISLLTHTCNSVALNIFLHPQLTLGHQSSCH